MRRLYFLLPLSLFLATALIGLGTAYDPRHALMKFVILASGMMVGMVLAFWPVRDLWWMVRSFSVIGGVIGLSYTLAGWYIPESTLDPDTVAGAMILLIPLALVWAMHPPVATRRWERYAARASGLAMLVGLLGTFSFDGWIALVVALGLRTTWLVAEKRRWPRSIAMGIYLVLLAGLMIGVWIFGPIGDVLSREEVYRNTLRLVSDYALTGSGLDSFPGLYSRYVLVIPDYFLPHSHNLYLNVALEQGVIGLGALLVLIGLAYLSLIAPAKLPGIESADEVRWAVIISLTTLCLQGLVEDALYGGRGTPLLFIPIGLAATFGLANEWQRRVWGIGLPVGAALAGVLALVFSSPLVSEFYANVGAVQLAKVELAGWAGNWYEKREFDKFQPAQASFEQALAWNSDNATAHHRLGWMASSQNNFAEAVRQFEAAYHVDPGRLGIVKSLGYAYVWEGQLDKAQLLLTQIPEAAYEMEIYSWWWGTQNQPEYAARAAQMAQRLKGGP